MAGWACFAKGRSWVRQTLLLSALLPTACGLLWACESEPQSLERPGDGEQAPGAAGPSPLVGGGLSAPEAELEENFRSPVVSGPYLWSANPESNRVARIDARNFEVQVVDSGHAPTFLAPLPEGGESSGALVLNTLGNDASFFRDADGMGGAGAGAIRESRFDVHDGASAWAVGKTGAVALAWSRFEEDLRGPLDGYQDLTVVFLGTGAPDVTRLSVGFRPTDVVINDQETRAYVVSDPGISVVNLSEGAPRVMRELFLPDGGDGRARDVSFSPDGALALVRLSERAEILIIETESDRRVTVSLPEEVTDLDLSGDGRLAVAVMRGQLAPGMPVPSPGSGQGGQGGDAGKPSSSASHIALLPVPEIFEQPSQYQLLFTEELVGSTVVAHDASVALFFTSAVANSHLTMLDIETESFRTVDLQAPTQAAFISDDGRYAAAVMTPPAGSGRSGAFALVPVFDELPLRIEGTSTVPRFISLKEDRVFVTTWGSSSAPAASFLGRFPELLVDRVELPSEPLASGLLLEARQAFVAQAHSEGRVTFVDLDDSSPTTVTGFELASKVVEE